MLLFLWEHLCGYILKMVNNEVEILRTVDIDKKDAFVRRLVNAGISYLEKWEKVPFFRRHEYNGAKEMCVIFVNDNSRERAEEILFGVENGDREVSRNRYKIKALKDKDKKSGIEDVEFFDDEDKI